MYGDCTRTCVCVCMCVCPICQPALSDCVRVSGKVRVTVFSEHESVTRGFFFFFFFFFFLTLQLLNIPATGKAYLRNGYTQTMLHSASLT